MKPSAKRATEPDENKSAEAGSCKSKQWEVEEGERCWTGNARPSSARTEVRGQIADPEVPMHSRKLGSCLIILSLAIAMCRLGEPLALTFGNGVEG